jgi:hypothetical protein
MGERMGKNYGQKYKHAAGKTKRDEWIDAESNRQGTERQNDAGEALDVLYLQRTMGNETLGRMLRAGLVRPKLDVGLPNDVYEQEADRVAEQVMAMSQEEQSETEPPKLRDYRGERVQLEEAPETGPGGEGAPPSLLVEDTQRELKPGQMAKNEFMTLLEENVRMTADEALAGTGRSADQCPYINKWMEYYRRSDHHSIERAVHKYAPETREADSAADYIRLICQKVHGAVLEWVQSGKIIGVPEEIVETGAGVNETGGKTGGEADTGVIRQKSRGRAGEEFESPGELLSRMGPGRPMDAPVKDRMERAFGINFSEVRVHTDTGASQLNRRLNARAFTVGRDIAFDSGEYRPGSPVGDALIAHELAHVAQQNAGKVEPQTNSPGEDSAVERDADRSAVSAVLSLWGSGKEAVKNLTKNAMPRLRTGLKLRRCQDTGESERVPEPVEQQAPPPPWFEQGTGAELYGNIYVRPVSRFYEIQQLLRQINILAEWDGTTYVNKGKPATQYLEGKLSFTSWTTDKIKEALKSTVLAGDVINDDKGNNSTIAAIRKMVKKQRSGEFSQLQGYQAIGSSQQGKCIGAMNEAIETLYGTRTLKKSELGDQAFESIDKLSGKGGVVSEKTFEMEYSGDDKELMTNFNSGNLTFTESPGTWIKNTVAAKSTDGIYAFPISLISGYHSILVIALKTGSDIVMTYRDQHRTEIKTEAELDTKFMAYADGYAKSILKKEAKKQYKKEFSKLDDKQKADVIGRAARTVRADYKKTRIALIASELNE